MKLPSEVQAVRARFYATFPIPMKVLGEDQAAFEQRVREYSTRFAQQVVHSVPGQGYGAKRGDRTRPISKDSLAQNSPDGLRSWDLFIGTGTGHPAPAADPDSEDIADQFFEALVPWDYLGAGATPVPGPPATPAAPPPAAPPAALDHLEALIKQLEDANEQRYRDLVAHVGDLKAMVAALPDGFTGRVELGKILGTRVGGTITLERMP